MCSMENDDDDDQIRPAKITNAMDSPSTMLETVSQKTAFLVQISSNGGRRGCSLLRLCPLLFWKKWHVHGYLARSSAMRGWWSICCVVRLRSCIWLPLLSIVIGRLLTVSPFFVSSVRWSRTIIFPGSYSPWVAMTDWNRQNKEKKENTDISLSVSRESFVRVHFDISASMLIFFWFFKKLIQLRCPRTCSHLLH